MTDLVRVEGLAECLNALSAFPDRLTFTVREALTSGCEAIAARARELVPVKPATKSNAARYGAVMGALRASITVLPPTINGSWVNCRVSAGSSIAFYARWVEFGTAPHEIKARYGVLLGTPAHPVNVVHHPGAKKNPFMRVAADTAADVAIARFAEFIKSRVESQGLNQTQVNG